jgi:hypothetical protein
VGDWLKHEQVPRTGIDAITAGGTKFDFHDRKPIGVHGDRSEITGDFAVGQSETAPGATLASAPHEMGSAAVGVPDILSQELRLSFSTAAMQTGDDLGGLSWINAQKRGDVEGSFGRRNGAATRRRFARDQFFSEGTTPGFTAGTAVRSRETVFNLIETRVFFHMQKTVSKGEPTGEKEAERGHDPGCGQDALHRPAFPVSGFIS